MSSNPQSARAIRVAWPCLTLPLALCYASGSVAAQLTRRVLEVNPPRHVLGQPVTLSVRGAPAGAQYRYVAKMTLTGGGDNPLGKGCPGSQSLGTGARVTWTPASGTYRLTAYGPNARAETDTLNLTFVLRPRVVMLASSQQPAQPSGIILGLRTDDLGPGHTYSWWMQYMYETGSGPGNTRAVRSTPWTSYTNGPLTTHPTAIPTSAVVSARVSVHRGSACEVIAAGAMGPLS